MARIPHTNFAVDYWRLDPGVNLRFLTHCHADHTKGLVKGWNNGIIYCSTISARILRHRFNIDPSIIRELEINSTILVFLDEAKTESMTVTAIDANHCPGSVMFLFVGYFGTVLHTGDFRWAHGAVDLSHLEGHTVDILYLDNTYLDSRQAQFPSREEAYELMREIVKQHMEHIIYVGVDSIGKEELLIALGREFGIKVAVTPERYRELALMGLADECFTCDESADAVVRVMPKERITMDFLREANESKSTIGILPTGWREKWANKLRPGRLYHVPYSLHSSYEEILDFVKAIRPRSVRLIVPDHGDMSVLSHLLEPSPQEPVRIPDVLRNPTLARLPPLVRLQRVPPPAFRRRTQSAGTLMIVKPEEDELDEKKCNLAIAGPKEEGGEVELDALSMLADALSDDVKVKQEDEEEQLIDELESEVRAQASSNSTPSDSKQFHKHTPLPLSVRIATHSAPLEASAPPNHSTATDDATALPPFSPPPAAGTPFRKRRYAHPNAASAHSARAVLARLGAHSPSGQI